VSRLANLERKLKTHNYKLTRQRRAVLRVLAESDSRFDAARIYEKAKVECPEIGLTTVYRTIDILVDLGVIERLHVAGGCKSYASASPGHRHHLVCVECGKAVEFVGCDLTGLIDSVASKTGFEVENHWLQLTGRCPKCQSKRK